MADVYEIITEQIIKRLEAGTVPWHCPWGGRNSMPRNAVSQAEYRGINSFILHQLRLNGGYESRYWLTFKQAKDRGGHVRKGEKSTPVIFWKWYDREEKNNSGEPTKQRLPVLRYYSVFNADQCEGVTVPKDNSESHEWEPLTACEQIVERMPDCPEIREGGVVAGYVPAEDVVRMPLRSRFPSAEGFYASLFHELTHATGHETRLNRRPSTDTRTFGDDAYSREELVAEMGAAFLCGHAGITPDTIENAASYIDGWLSVLRADSRLVIQAAAQAQKAADFILGRTWDNDSETPAKV